MFNYSCPLPQGFKGLNHRSFQAKINITKGHAVESEREEGDLFLFLRGVLQHNLKSVAFI
jgi:hypothetical protein